MSDELAESLETMTVEELAETVFKTVKAGNAAQLSKICSSKHQQAVQILLTHTDNQGTTALLMSVAGAFIDLSKLLLKLGANVNDMNAYGWTPLMVAALNGDQAHVRLLLDHGAQVDTLSAFGLTAIACASHSANLPVAQQILESGANVNLSGSPMGFTPLMFAAASGSTDLVTFLLQNGAECNAQNKLNGWTAVMYAVNNLSLEAGDQAHSGASGGASIAKRWFSSDSGTLWRGVDAVRMLLDFGADIDIKNWADQRAADIASIKSKECGDVFAKLCKERRSRAGQSTETSNLQQLSPIPSKQGWFSRLTSDFGAQRDRSLPAQSDDLKRMSTRSTKGSRWTNITEDPGVPDPSYVPPMQPQLSAGALRSSSTMRRTAPSPASQEPPVSIPESWDPDASGSAAADSFLETSSSGFGLGAIPKRPKNLEINRERTMRAPSPTTQTNTTQQH
ncbi:ankyrin repeat-containing domain protein [Entophlyctis helioformis]|nr:ankyrin repeat-containing domain protein [Entophlyctis helioformis]